MAKRKKSEKDEDFRWLLIAIIFGAAGLVGVNPFNYYILIVCEGVAAGAVLKFRDVRINYKKQSGNDSVMAEQRGRGNTMTSQTSPTNSPVIHSQGDVYIGATPTSQVPKTAYEETKESTWWINRTIALDEFEEFGTYLNEGDELVGRVKSEDWISVQIMGQSSLNSLKQNYNINPYQDSGKVKETDVHYTSPKARNTFVVIVDEEEDSGETEGEVIVQLGIIRKDSE